MESSEETNASSVEWEQIKDLVLAAQEEAPADLDAWLSAHCPTDSTRQEVARLVHASEAAGDFLEGSASEKHLGLRPLHPARIGRYRIVEELGSGGLGMVYAAHDDLLNRPVALKVLRSPESTSSELRKRLLWDARAACSLQHPNIVVVYDIGADHGLDYIVMERVHGQTLTQGLAPGGMPPVRAVAIAIQIASGLEAAHAAGIVHRDLKPTNIMIGADDSVKILDFGLAKPDAHLPQDSQTPLTIEGRFAGTVAYVAPEQAEGKAVDARADIFSFGCVLFELLTGRQAFQGQSSMSVVAKILQQEAPAVNSVTTGLDPRLGDIVARCLRKNPDERFQTVSELKERLSECAAPVRFAVPRISWRRAGWAGWAAAAGVLALACVLTWLAVGHFQKSSREPPYFLTRLTADGGLTEYPAISPDAKFLAFASDRAGHGNLDIWVQPITGSEPVQLTFGPANASEPVFSPDGTQLAFHFDGPGAGLYIVSTLGGKPRLLVSRGHDPRFSPDGRWLAFWVGAPGASLYAGSAQALVIPATGGVARPIATNLEASFSPVWEPGGNRLLCVGRGKGEEKIRWWLADFKQQFARPTTILASLLDRSGLDEPQGSDLVSPLAWLADHTVLMAARQIDSNNIWGLRVSSDGPLLEAPRRWTGGTALERHASAAIAPNGTVRLVYDALNATTSIRRVALTPGGAAASPPQLFLKGYGNMGSPSLSADGNKMAFTTREPRRQFLRVLDVASGLAATVATIESSLSDPAVLSGDGGTLAYWNGNTGYLMSSKGGAAEAVCSHCGPPSDASFDGSAALFESGAVPNQLFLCTRQAPQQPIARIVDRPALYMAAGRWSPDHRWILFCGTENHRKTVYLVPVTPDGTATAAQLVPVSGGEYDAWEPAWSPDGRHIYFIANVDGFGCIWGRDIDPAAGRPSGSVFPVAHFHHVREIIRGPSAALGDIGLSAARGFLVFTVTETTGEAWLRTILSRGRP
jgi:Tol biopolymer transport system component